MQQEELRYHRRLGLTLLYLMHWRKVVSISCVSRLAMQGRMEV